MTRYYGSFLSSLSVGVAGSFGAALLLTLIECLAKKKPLLGRKLMATLQLVVLAIAIVTAWVLGVDLHLPVPNLDYLTMEDAVSQLISSKLVPELILVDQATPERFGRVIANSQRLPGGQLVPSGSAVPFEVADQGVIRLEHPQTNSTVDCRVRPLGFCTLTVDGASSKLLSSGRVDLVVVTRSAESNWYVQRSIDVPIAPDGTWKGEAQIGNPRYPPSDGELVEVALVVVPHGVRIPQSGRGGLQHLETKPIDRAERVTVRVIHQ
jgi:hypothetical protein